jgi:hypothetical protein
LHIASPDSQTKRARSISLCALRFTEVDFRLHSPQCSTLDLVAKVIKVAVAIGVSKHETVQSLFQVMPESIARLLKGCQQLGVLGLKLD